MTKLWNYLKKHWSFNFRTHEKNWQSYYEEEPDYFLLKKTAAALAIFAVVYGGQVSDTRIGQEIVGGVRQILATQTDFVYYTASALEYINAHWPNAANWGSIPVLKQVQATISHPADPLRYMTKPVEGPITSPYGWQANQASTKQEVLQEGIDIAAPTGTGVQAAAAGKVKVITDSSQLGKMLIIDHGQGIETIYGRLGDILVKEADIVSQGQIIARIAKVGTATPGLYFELRENGKAVDPLTRMKSDSAK